MGIDVYGLITDWRPIVADCRASGGMDFYWDAEWRDPDARWQPGEPDLPDEDLPYADEHVAGGGKAFLSVGRYYGRIEPHLGERDRRRAQAFLGLVYHLDGDPVDDLSADAGMRPVGDVLYSMRPSTVPSALELEAAMPWRAMEEAADRAARVGDLAELGRVRDHGSFEGVMELHRTWMQQAASSGRGLVVVWS